MTQSLLSLGLCPSASLVVPRQTSQSSSATSQSGGPINIPHSSSGQSGSETGKTGSLASHSGNKTSQTGSSTSQSSSVEVYT